MWIKLKRFNMKFRSLNLEIFLRRKIFNLCTSQLTTFGPTWDYVESSVKVVNGRWKMNWKWCRKLRLCLNVKNYWSNVLEVLRNTTKNVVSITCLRAGVWTWDLLNSKPRYCRWEVTRQPAWLDINHSSYSVPVMATDVLLLAINHTPVTFLRSLRN